MAEKPTNLFHIYSGKINLLQIWQSFQDSLDAFSVQFWILAKVNRVNIEALCIMKSIYLFDNVALVCKAKLEFLIKEYDERKETLLQLIDWNFLIVQGPEDFASFFDFLLLALEFVGGVVEVVVVVVVLVVDVVVVVDVVDVVVVVVDVLVVLDVEVLVRVVVVDVFRTLYIRFFLVGTSEWKLSQVHRQKGYRI